MSAESSYIPSTAEEYWDDLQVAVIVPTQAVAGQLSIVRLDLPNPDKVPPTPNTFIPTRLVVNFEVRKADDQTLVQQFSPPMVLRVGFNEEELAAAAEGQELKLAFWDGSRWVVFTKEKHHLELHSTFAIALIRHWGDPTMAVGR
jgi:hypothetical protein